MSSLAKAIVSAVERRDLSREQARDALGEIMEGAASPAQVAAFLVALRMKGETAEELAGFAEIMRTHVSPVRSDNPRLVDTCGTGGDSFKTFNVSTAAAFIASAAGAMVAKHGNRSVSGLCGSADVLEALGVRLDISTESKERALVEVGLAFLFAPAHHPAMKHVAPVRKELALRTVFNLLGPLTNPAGAKRQVIGVSSDAYVTLMANALCALGCERGVIVHGEPGMDEVSAIGNTEYAIVENGEVTEGIWTTEELGLRPVLPEQIAAPSDVPEHAKMLRLALSDANGPLCEAAVGTAGCALWAAGGHELAGCVATARGAVASGAALEKLEEYIRFTNEHP